MKLLIATLSAAAMLTACGGYGSKSTTAPAVASASTPAQAADGTLIGPKGMTLYTFSRDVAGSGQSACVAQCAANWPPLGVEASAKNIGDYTIITRADGTRQWAYKGMPLYYFVKDTKPGDKTGDGVGGNWKTAVR